MIDSSTDAGFAAFERAEARRAPRRADSAASRRPRPSGTLAALPSAPPALASSGALAVGDAASVAVPAPSPAPREASDPLAHLRAARIGFAAALALVVFFIWLRQRRTDSWL